jgi:hypothetical protein
MGPLPFSGEAMTDKYDQWLEEFDGFLGDYSAEKLELLIKRARWYLRHPSGRAEGSLSSDPYRKAIVAAGEAVMLLRDNWLAENPGRSRARKGLITSAVDAVIDASPILQAEREKDGGRDVEDAIMKIVKGSR